MKWTINCFFLLFFIASNTFATTPTPPTPLTTAEPELSRSELSIAAAKKELLDPIFVERFTTNLTNNGNASFTFNRAHLVDDALKALVKVYPDDYAGSMVYKFNGQTFLDNNPQFSMDYPQLLPKLVKEIQTPYALPWLNIPQASLLPTRFYYSNLGYKVILLNCQAYGCQSEMAILYNQPNEKVFGYIDLPSFDANLKLNTVYLFGIQNQDQLATALALKARRAAESNRIENI